MPKSLQTRCRHGSMPLSLLTLYTACCHAYTLFEYFLAQPPLHIFKKRFLSCFCDYFWLSLIFSEYRQLHAATATYAHSFAEI